MSGTVALGLVTAGALLIFVECNRPGRVLPGAAGVLLTLLGVSRLMAFVRWNDGAPWLALAGVAMIGSLRWRSRNGIPGVVGTALLTAALVQLAKHSEGALPPLPAACCGLLLGAISSWLMMVAGLAWRAKGSHYGASAERERTGAVEHWGVD